MTEYNVCGVLVHAILEQIGQVRNHLESLNGVEVHQTTDDGRLVVTVESGSRRYVADTISSLHEIDGVLSASMVFQFNDEIEPEDSQTQGEMSV